MHTLQAQQNGEQEDEYEETEKKLSEELKMGEQQAGVFRDENLTIRSIDHRLWTIVTMVSRQYRQCLYYKHPNNRLNLLKELLIILKIKLIRFKKPFTKRNSITGIHLSSLV